jgi:carbonic anhydrase
MYSAEDDNFNKMYYNQVHKPGNGPQNVPVKWVGDTSKTEVKYPDTADAKGTTSFFYSEFGAYIGGPTQYGADQFHFHTGSEHTVDGVRHDLEMHTVHFPKNAKGGIIAAAMGIFFSTNRYTARVSEAEEAIIDEFFDSLMWDKTGDQRSPKVTYGNLMMMVNMRTRWSYKGSVTTPPCATTVYWNVVKTIYPLKQKHLDQFKTQMQRGVGATKFFDAANVSNYRLIQDTGNRVVTHIYEPSRVGGYEAAVIVLAILLAFVLLFCAVCYQRGTMKFNSSDMEGPKDVEMKQEGEK